MTATDSPSHDAALDQLIHSERAVVFVSNLTDARPVLARLETAGIGHRVAQMGMGDAAMRERFHRLEQRTGWQTLPQVFVDGEFVGGIDEALGHPLLAGGPDPATIRSWTEALGYAGLIPFIALTALVWLAPGSGAAFMLAAYGATVLAFLGAVHWGWVLAGAHSRLSVPASLSWGVIPAVAAWLSLALVPPAALALQAAVVALAWYVDRRAWTATPDLGWYLRLRTRLSAAVAALLIAAAPGAA